MNCIEVKNVFKSYKNFDKRDPILDGLNLTVKSGEIYSLIGASGCGKTTLFTCLMGMQKIEEGEMEIFNEKVSHKRSSKYSHLIGYMPQQIALVLELTIRETLQYFGDLHMMESKKLKSKVSEISALLDLPDVDCQIRNLSGGQKRRVSLAVAILHSPKLLLLDEPTVGLDYILREKIWKFLRESTENYGTSVVITTHYIDEAKHSDRCGFMRNGKIIAQDSPANILAQLDCETLDEAFFILSKRNEIISSFSYESGTVVNTNAVVETFNSEVGNESRQEEKFIEGKKFHGTTRIRVIKAMLVKEIHRIRRQPIEIFFILLFPLLMFYISLCAIGTIPSNLKIGIISRDLYNLNECNGTTINCANEFFPCTFIQEFDEKMLKILYNSFNSAMEDLKADKLNGIVMIPSNFTELNEDNYSETENIEVYLDYKMFTIDLFMKIKIFEAYNTALEKLSKNCSYENKIKLMKFNFMYGNMNFNFRKFFGAITSFSMLFLISMAFKSLAIHAARMEGVWNRTLLSGATITEIVFSNLVFASIYSSILTLQFMVSMSFAIDVEITRNSWILIFIAYAVANLGYVWGIFISTCVDNFHVMYGLGIIVSYGMINLCGLIWPTEAIHPLLKPLSDFIPTTHTSKSFLNVLVKNLGLFDSGVYIGVIYVLVWIAVVSILCKIVLSMKKFPREV